MNLMDPIFTDIKVITGIKEVIKTEYSSKTLYRIDKDENGNDKEPEIIDKTDAQVIFTSHNTNLMNNNVFRPDCLFILQNNGIRAMCDLTEKELRKAHNLQKMYKAGAFE